MIPIPSCRVITAPSDGRLSSSLAPDTLVAKGQVIASFETLQGLRTLLAPVAGTFGGTLVGTRHTVTSGDGVVWLARR